MHSHCVNLYTFAHQPFHIFFYTLCNVTRIFRLLIWFSFVTQRHVRAAHFHLCCVVISLTNFSYTRSSTLSCKWAQVVLSLYRLFPWILVEYPCRTILPNSFFPFKPGRAETCSYARWTAEELLNFGPRKSLFYENIKIKYLSTTSSICVPILLTSSEILHYSTRTPRPYTKLWWQGQMFFCMYFIRK